MPPPGSVSRLDGFSVLLAVCEARIRLVVVEEQEGSISFFQLFLHPRQLQLFETL